MRKLKLIIAREYWSMVGRKSFIILTLLIPFLFILCMAAPALIAYYNDTHSDVEHITIVDETGHYGTALHSDDRYAFTVLGPATDSTDPRTFIDNARNAVDALVVIPRDVDSTRAVTIYAHEAASTDLKLAIQRALTDTLATAALNRYGGEALTRLVDRASTDVDVKSVTWDDQGKEHESSAELLSGIGFALSFLIYMFVLIYGAMVMNSVVEEKTNRIAEVMVSSCRPFQLMAGKIIGIGLVGLTQIAVWCIMGAIALGILALCFGDTTAGATASQAVTQAQSTSFVNYALTLLSGINFWGILLGFIIYFIGGYLLYAALFAAFGSAVDQASEASQFTTPVVILMIIALYAGMACIESPDGPMALWCSLIPFTSPVVMMVRLPQGVPLWQLILSLLILYLTTALIIWIAGRIYRRGILHYGQKASLRTLLHWL